MSEITEAITTRQAQIKTLQSDIDALQRAATVLGGKTTAKATSQPKAKRKRRKRRAVAKTMQKRKPMWSAADKKAISKRMKAYWAKRRKAKG